MAIRIIMPKLGLTMTRGKIIRWLKKEGDYVKKGEPLLEIMTEKIVTEVESPGEGLLAKIFNKPEEYVDVTEVIALLVSDDDNIDELIREINAEKSLVKETIKDDVKEHSEELEIDKVFSTISPDHRVKSSPLAKRIAKEEGVYQELSRVQGTGPGGRIIKKDVLTYIEQIQMDLSFAKTTLKTRIEQLSELRKSIATNLSKSWQTPHFYLESEVDAGPILEMRMRINQFLKQEDLKVTITDLIVKIVAYVLSENSNINVSFSEKGINYHGEINIGVAVSIDEGLIVPVIRNADRKGIRQISKENKMLIKKAREGNMTLDNITGGTFTVSNLGMFPVDSFTAIINPPEAAILAVGQVVEKPVIVKGDIVKRSCMRITVGFDHRVVDGAKGAKFIAALKESLENPYLLTL